MLPTSHLSPRIGPDPVFQPKFDLEFGGTLREESSESRAIGHASLLADAFTEFIAAAGRLEASYAELQEQVAQLGVELAERNAELNASLAENERMRLALQQIVDSMPCGVLVLEKDGALSMINPEGRRLLELRAEGEPAQSSATVLPSLTVLAGIDLAKFASQQAVFEGEQEFCLTGPSGKRWIEARNRRLFGDQSSQSWHQTILILRDVTAHKQAERERERGRKATALAEVAAMLAHEIRNPLASMELFAGLLADSESIATSQGPERRWISHMRAGIRSLSGTVNNVLSFQGVAFPARVPLEIAAAIDSSVEFVRPIADQSGVSLSFSAATRGARVLGNADALQQLVLNLVANAVRHTPKGGQVQVRVSETESCGLARHGKHTEQRRGLAQPAWVRIECADTGSGIRPEHLGEVFRAGFSASGNTSGLGLAVCSQIVRQHQGKIGVDSTPAAGTTFFVELPTL